MDQQNHNYESFNDFSFVNAFAAGSENYAINQQQTVGSDIKNMNEIGLPALINQDFDSRTIGNASLYDLSNPHYSNVTYHNQMTSTTPVPVEQENVNIHSCNTEASQKSGVNKIQTDNFPEQQHHPPIKLSSDTVTFDPSQNSMLKALGVVRKDVLSASSNKKRKRIVVLNDDSDDETRKNINVDEKKNEFETIASDERNDASESDIQTDNEECEENLTDIGALKAKFLLKNAVMIQGPGKKKKTSRLLDSDDENPIQTTSVDDIGLINDDENEEEAFENDILISEPIISIECPVISVTSSETCQDEIGKLNTSATEFGLKTLESANAQEECGKSEATPVTIENKPEIQLDTTEQKSDAPTAEVCSQSKVQSADENEIDPSMTVEAILENIKPMADDDEFFKFEKSSDENEKSVPNDEYFGTPDKQQQQR